MTTIELEFTTNMMSNQVLGGGGGQAPQGVTVRIMQPGVPSTGVNEKPSVRNQKLSAFEHNEGFEVYKPNMFTITAYLPNDGREGEKRLKVCLRGRERGGGERSEKVRGVRVLCTCACSMCLCVSLGGTVMNYCDVCVSLKDVIATFKFLLMVIIVCMYKYTVSHSP